MTEKIKAFKEESAELRKKFRECESENYRLKANPIVRIDPMKIEVYIYESVINHGSVYGGQRVFSYPFVKPINVDLDSKLSSQISNISKLIATRYLEDMEKKYDKKIDLFIATFSDKLGRMSFIEKIKFLRKEKYNDTIKAFI